MKPSVKWLPILLLVATACQLPILTPQATGAAPTSASQPQATRPAGPASATTGVWLPAPGTSWQWELADNPPDLSVEAEVYDVDLFDTDAAIVQEIHARGSKAICYISVGSWEDWRPDKDQFPEEVLGNDYEGWPGERWLDIRQIDALAPVLRARFDLCLEKGFDGIEPDNINGYTNDTGFPLSADDQLHFNIWLAEEAHIRGLSIGLKNDNEQTADLLPYYDWAMAEDCFDQGWCGDFLPFIDAGKAVFAAEYSDTGITVEDFCPQAVEMGFSAILKNRDLDAYRETCDE